MQVTEPQTKQVYKTCRVTVVTPGQSDAVIKIFPAEHESEKIWKDNTQGIERWEAVKRMMFQFAKRGTAVPEPVKYHPDIKDLRTVAITEADIPLVVLEGEVFKPKDEPAALPPQPQLQSPQEMAKRLDGLENSISQLTNLMLNMKIAQGGAVASAPILPSVPVSHPAPSIKADPPAQSFGCVKCGKTLKNETGLRLHMGRFHKED